MQFQQQHQLIPFGKYKGQPIEALMADPGYAQWLMAQSWFQERFPQFYTLIIHQHGEPEETPEHNAMQLRFLDEGLRQKLASLVCVASERQQFYPLTEAEAALAGILPGLRGPQTRQVPRRISETCWRVDTRRLPVRTRHPEEDTR